MQAELEARRIKARLLPDAYQLRARPVPTGDSRLRARLGPAGLPYEDPSGPRRMTTRHGSRSEGPPMYTD